MHFLTKSKGFLAIAALWLSHGASFGQFELPGTGPWSLGSKDPAMLMVDRISADLEKRISEASARRTWAGKPGESSFRSKKARLAEILGVVDPRTAYPKVEIKQNLAGVPVRIGDIVVDQVTWPVLEGVNGEGLLLQNPNIKAKRNLIVMGDASETPEELIGMVGGGSAKSERLLQAAMEGDRVWILPLINRLDDRSGNDLVGRYTNQPHREFVYRMAFEMGRHLIGYEVQRVSGLLDALVREENPLPFQLWGWGEGGVVALQAAALDERISKVGLSGSFSPREKVWAEPIYRNVWSYVSEFGDAGAAVLLGNRGLVVSNEAGPKVAGPPAPRNLRGGAAPGKLDAYDWASVKAEFDLALKNRGSDEKASPWYLEGNDEAAWSKFVDAQGNPNSQARQESKAPVGGSISKEKIKAEIEQRHLRLFQELINHVQLVWKRGDRSRMSYFDGNATARSGKWVELTKQKRAAFDESIMGSLKQSAFPKGAPVPATSRVIYETPEFRGWEVEMPLPVSPGVFAQGIYLLPKDLKPGEKRPVVVCQHGLEGRPQDVCNPLAKTPYYNSFGAELARKGYIVFAPQNPYIGYDRFRVLQRKANSIGLSLFSYITAQHRVILDWLKTRPEVDGERLAFYGLSYGGKTAMRVPAILEDYCLSICSGDFNEWVGKNVAYEPWGAYTSYIYTPEYEIFEWNLGNTFNYAEMAYLIAPRPFMVERGHDDGVGIDPMVSWEYAKVREVYSRLGLSDRTEIEYFPGGHEIRGKGTFEFLKKHLKYPR